MKRRWLRRFLIILGAYLSVVLLLVAAEDALVFRAKPASKSWHEPRTLAVEDVYFSSADGTRIHAWWLPAPGSQREGAILFCHGQQGNLSWRLGLYQRLQRLGMPILAFDYPGFGRSEGSPTEQGCYAAADAAYNWLVEQRGIPPDQIIVVGKSLGGGIATDLASRRPCCALVLVMTFTSVPDVAQRLLPFVPANLLMHNRFDNLAKIGLCDCPVYLAHGEEDWKIPPSHSEKLFEAAPDPRRYFPMPGVGHGWPWLTDACLADLAEFLQHPARSASAN